VFPQMQPGVYDIIVEMPGFKKYDKKNVTLYGNEKLSVGTFSLEVGALEQSIEVNAQAIELQTESGERGSTLNNKQLENTRRQRAHLPGLGRADAGRGDDVR